MKSKTLLLKKALLFVLLTSQAYSENIISFDNIQMDQGNDLTIDVCLANSDTIAGMQLPITFGKMPEGFIIDTVLFEGSRCADFEMKLCEILNGQNGVFFNLISNVTVDSQDRSLVPGSGLLCRLHFTWPESLDIHNENQLIHRGFLLKKAKILRERNGISFRDFRFTIWKPDATEIAGKIEPLILRNPR